MDLITSLSIELEYFIYLVMVTCHLKRATINEAYIKKTKRKRVANATPTNSMGFLKTPTNYIEPKDEVNDFFIIVFNVLNKNI